MAKVEAGVAVRIVGWTASEEGGQVPAYSHEPHLWGHPEARTVGEVEAKLKEAGFRFVRGPQAVQY